MQIKLSLTATEVEQLDLYCKAYGLSRPQALKRGLAILNRNRENADRWRLQQATGEEQPAPPPLFKRER